MKFNVYAVYDSKAQAYMQPFFMRTRGEAIRAWQSSISDEKTNFCKWPEDYSLFEIGSFDDVEGVIDSATKPVNLGLASQYIKQQEPTPLEEHISELKKGVN